MRCYTCGLKTKRQATHVAKVRKVYFVLCQSCAMVYSTVENHGQIKELKDVRRSS